MAANDSLNMTLYGSQSLTEAKKDEGDKWSLSDYFSLTLEDEYMVEISLGLNPNTASLLCDFGQVT